MRKVMALAAALVTASAGAADLQIDVQGVQGSDGTIRLALYQDPKTFRKEDQSLLRQTQPAHPGAMTFKLPNLAPGRYAVIVYHDADNNGEMNRFLGMIPTESYGLSTNPRLMGRPAFSDAAFDLPAQGKRLQIRMHY
jgi:uncharacterized protein (DUF2141 family)